jgi:hypothetical protein
MKRFLNTSTSQRIRRGAVVLGSLVAIWVAAGAPFQAGV